MSQFDVWFSYAYLDYLMRGNQPDQTGNPSGAGYRMDGDRTLELSKGRHDRNPGSAVSGQEPSEQAHDG